MQWIISLLFLCVLTGCGGSNSEKTAANLSGNWQIIMQGNIKAPSGFLLQSGTSLNGDFLVSGNCSGVGPAQGQLDGLNVSMTLDASDQTLNFTGTTTSDGTSMSGNYSFLGSGCGGSEVGTWTGTQISALNSSFQATFTSGDFPGLVFHFSGTLSQGPNTGASYATLSGNMSSTDAVCFTTASVSGQISGTAVVLNLTNSEGIALGKITTTLTTDISSMTGTYAFVNFTVPIACGSDFGNVVFTMSPSST
jgi:hypothetical protein